MNLETSTFSKLTGTIARPAGSGSQKLRVYSNGVVKIGSTSYFLTTRMRGRTVIAAWDPHGVLFANTDGEVIAEYLWPPEGTGYVGNNRNLTRLRRGPHALQLSPMW